MTAPPGLAPETEAVAPELDRVGRETSLAIESATFDRVLAAARWNSGCIVPSLTVGPKGYTKVRIGSSRQPGTKTILTHRLAFAVALGVTTATLSSWVDADGQLLTVDHRCRNRACINRFHLELVENRTNVLRGIGITAVNAIKSRCIRGHRLPAGGRNGWRECKRCAVIRATESANRTKELR